MSNVRFVFCATSSLKSPKSLTLIFSLCKNMIISTNSQPVMNGKIMTDYNNFRYDEVRKIFTEKKLPLMKKELELSEKDIYFDSSCLFIKSYAKIACEELARERERLSIIHLIENPIDVSLSLYREKETPSFEEDKFFLNLGYPANRIKPDFLKYREYNHRFFKIFWYCLECYVRSKELISRYRNVKHYVFFTNWLNSEFELKSLFNSLGCNINRRRLESASKVYNNYQFIENKFPDKKGREFLDKENAIKLARKFISKFGDTFQLSKEECEELINL